MIISLDTEKTSHTLMIDAFIKVGLENFLNLTKQLQKNIIILIDKQLEAFLLRSETMQRCTFPPFLFNTVLQ